MLAFLINNTPLALSTDTSVRITWYNPACFFDSIPGDVGMGIDIPVNEVNRMLLGNPGRYEKSGSSREIPGFEIRFGGVLLLAGTLVIQSANDQSYSGWLRSNVGNLGKEHREKYIYDIPAFNENISFVNKASYDPDTDHYGCPEIYNPDFFRDKGRRKEYTRQIINPDWYPGSEEPQVIDSKYETELLTKGFANIAEWRVNKRNPDNTIMQATILFAHPDSIDTEYITVVSPMLFLTHVVESLLRDAKFYIVSNAIADNADLKKLLIYNNFDITKTGFITLDIFENGQWFDGLSYISRGTVVENIYRNYTDTFKYKDLLPKIKLKDFILGIQNLLNVCFHFMRNGKVKIIDRETIITTAAIDINKYLVKEWEMGEKKDVTLKFTFDHDKDDTYFQERWEDIDDRRTDEKEPVATLAALDLITEPTVGEMRYVQDLNIYMQYAWIQVVTGIDPQSQKEIQEDRLGWFYMANGFQNGFFNTDQDEEEEIKTAFSTLAYSPGISTPETQQPGNMKSIKFSYQNFTPRLLFYLANNTAKHETDNISIDWEKQTTGLIAKRWPKWARFWCQRQPVSREAALPLNIIDYVTRNITNKFRAREGEFIIEQMETEFSLNSIGASKITGYKNDYVPKSHSLTEHWAPGNLVWMDEVIDFTGFDNMNFNI